MRASSYRCDLKLGGQSILLYICRWCCGNIKTWVTPTNESAGSVAPRPTTSLTRCVTGSWRSLSSSCPHSAHRGAQRLAPLVLAGRGVTRSLQDTSICSPAIVRERLSGASPELAASSAYLCYPAPVLREKVDDELCLAIWALFLQIKTQPVHRREWGGGG